MDPKTASINFGSIRLNSPESQYHLALSRAFEELDLHQTGRLDRSDIQVFMAEAAKHVKLNLEPELLEAAVDALMEDAGVNIEEQSYISKDQFLNIFERHPDMFTVFQDEASLQSLQQSVRSETLSEEELKEVLQWNEQAWVHARWTEWKNRKVAIVWFLLYLAANVFAFTYKAIKYVNHEEAMAVFGNCIAVARGGAQCLNLNAGLILLPISRQFLTKMRAVGPMRYLFPFDATIEIHILIGSMLGLFATAHTCAHICDFHRFARADEDDIFALFGTKLGETMPESHWGRWKVVLATRAGITGIIMVVCCLVAYPTTQMRHARFNLFWSTHHLLLVMMIALAVHGTDSLLEPFQSVYWMAGPLLLYFLPRFWRETPLSKTNIVAIQHKPGGVVALQLEKPRSWKGVVTSGMYAFLNIPTISKVEWHPFTLTSAPDDNYIEFNFKAVGDWTTAVHDLLEAEATDEPVSKEAASGGNTVNANGYSKGVPSSVHSIVVKVEGPIGASSQGFSDYPVVVLVGAGIGATPCISVLKHLLTNPGKMKRCFFYWTTRDRSSFEWFSSLTDAIYESDKKHVLQIRHFLTSGTTDDRDIGAVLLHHATRAHHKKTDIDLLLGRRGHHQVEVGRPDWDDELVTVRDESKESGFDHAGVFFCGPEKMGHAISEVSKKLSKEDTGFHFYFSKETF